MATLKLGMELMKTDIEEFKKITLIIKELLNSDSAKILFGIKTNIKLEVDYTKLSKYEIENKVFNKVVNMEFIPILQSILEDSKDVFLRGQLREFRENKKQKDDVDKFKKQIEEKIDYVEHSVVDDILISRYRLKASSKNLFIKDINWEINNKLFESNEKEMNSLYSTVKIKLNNQFEENMIFKFFPFADTDDKISEITIDCDEYDIDYLIKVLSDVKENIIKRR